MDTDNCVELERIRANERRSAVTGSKSSAAPGESLGRLIAVGGSHAMIEFARSAEGTGPDVSVGSLLAIDGGGSVAIGVLSELSLGKSDPCQDRAQAAGRIDLLGEITCEQSGDKNFQRGIAAYPGLGCPVFPVGSEELQIIFGLESADTVQIGHLRQNGSIAASINIDETVRKHFAIFGSTGAGKSTGLTILLSRIMEAQRDLRILLIDAHNEYGRCFGERAHVIGPGNLRLPFWLLNFDEIAEIIFGQRAIAEQEVALLADLIPLAKNEYRRSRAVLRSSYRQPDQDSARSTIDTPVPYRLADLISLTESRMGKLENGALAVHYQRLLMRIHAARQNPRYAFIFDEADDGNDTMAGILSQLLRLSGDGKQMTVVQLAGFPAETMEVIVSALFRLAFEFGIWSDGTRPLLIVCEEAHSYANADRTVGFQAAREGLSRIAKEGRKHGVFLGLVSQRPHQLDGTLISQCSTVFAMRLGHEDDQKVVRAAVSDSGSRLLGFLPSLGTREALVVGAGVPTAMRMRFEQAADHGIPRSQAVWGGAAGGDGAAEDFEFAAKVDEQLVASVVARWRGTAISNKPVLEPSRSSMLAEGDPTRWSAG